MKIKDIKAIYEDESNKCLSHTFDQGKCVVVVNYFYGMLSVVHIIRVADGVDLIPDRARACDSLADAIVVAEEMLMD